MHRQVFRRQAPDDLKCMSLVRPQPPDPSIPSATEVHTDVSPLTCSVGLTCATSDAIVGEAISHCACLRSNHWFRVKTLALECAHPQGAVPVDHLSRKPYARGGFEQAEDAVVLCRECDARHHRTLAPASVWRPIQNRFKAPMISSTEIRWLRNVRVSRVVPPSCRMRSRVLFFLLFEGP